MKLPSQFEQDTAKEYCLRRKLDRPNTTVKKCVLCALVFEIAATILSAAFYIGLNWLGSFSFLSSIFSFREVHPFLSFFIFWIIANALLFIIFSRMIFIGAVKLYQHYSPEDVRRRCVCMPTCSEYTIMAIRHYGVIIGGFKAYVRLFHHCKGSIYSIDYPFPKYWKHYANRK